MKVETSNDMCRRTQELSVKSTGVQITRIKHEKSGLFITHNGKAGNGRGTGWNVEATPKAELHLAGHTGFNSAIKYSALEIENGSLSGKATLGRRVTYKPNQCWYYEGDNAYIRSAIDRSYCLTLDSNNMQVLRKCPSPDSAEATNFKFTIS
ncbi:hypothetical protein GWI33_020132 [Rhynchophorus ferrugineus]|uniref:Uncharacterized protein n=1 Tax=Rhynchophorus ferrugineus TaxID=354439 RepID=A0A834I450_RHYFE|nr:hypothetical protein GWI33_020132 [Rhynchophorus ferrugineus]